MINTKIKKWLLSTFIACILAIVSVCVVVGLNSNKKAFAAETSTTELTSQDLLFDEEIGVGNKSYNGSLNLHHLQFTLKVGKAVNSLVDSIDFTLIQGADKFDIETSSFTKVDGTENGDYVEYNCKIFGSPDTSLTNIQVKASVKIGEDTYTLLSKTTNLINEWRPYAANNFEGSPFAASGRFNQGHILSSIKAYDDGFYNEIKLLKNSFATYNKDTHALPLNATMFRVKLENNEDMFFNWSVMGADSVHYITQIAVIADYWTVDYVSVFSQIQTESGQEQTNYPEIGEAIENSIECASYDGYCYFRISDDSAMKDYFPEGSRLIPTAYSFVDSVNVIEVNTACVVIDDKTNELLAEIDSLSSQLDVLQVEIDEINALCNNQKIQIDNLANQVNDLQTQLGNSSSLTDNQKEQIVELTNQINELQSQLNESNTLANNQKTQIINLTKQISDLQSQLKDSNSLTATQKAEIDSLLTRLNASIADYNQALKDIEAANEETELVKQECQAKIAEMLDEKAATEENQGLSLTQIIAISAGCVILVAIVLLLIPLFKKNKKDKQYAPKSKK